MTNDEIYNLLANVICPDCSKTLKDNDGVIRFGKKYSGGPWNPSAQRLVCVGCCVAGWPTATSVTELRLDA